MARENIVTEVPKPNRGRMLVFGYIWICVAWMALVLIFGPANKAPALALFLAPALVARGVGYVVHRLGQPGWSGLDWLGWLFRVLGFLLLGCALTQAVYVWVLDEQWLAMFSITLLTYLVLLLLEEQRTREESAGAGRMLVIALALPGLVVGVLAPQQPKVFSLAVFEGGGSNNASFRQENFPMQSNVMAVALAEDDTPTAYATLKGGSGEMRFKYGVQLREIELRVYYRCNSLTDNQGLVVKTVKLGLSKDQDLNRLEDWGSSARRILLGGLYQPDPTYFQVSVGVTSLEKELEHESGYAHECALTTDTNLSLEDWRRDTVE